MPSHPAPHTPAKTAGTGWTRRAGASMRRSRYPPTRHTGSASRSDSVIRLRHPPLWPRLPSPVDPQVLPRVGPDEVLDPLRIPLGDVPQRVVLVLPVGGVDDVLHADA